MFLLPDERLHNADSLNLSDSPGHRVSTDAELHQVWQRPEAVQLRRIGQSVLSEAEAQQGGGRGPQSRRQNPEPVILHAELPEVSEAAQGGRGAQLADLVAVQVDFHQGSAAVQSSQVGDVVSLGWVVTARCTGTQISQDIAARLEGK